MKLVPTDEISLYDFAVGLWNREDVDTKIQLIPGQTLLMRRVGITRYRQGACALCALKAQAGPRTRSLQSCGAGAAHNADTCTLRTFVASKSCQLLFHPFPVAVGPLVAG
ncbi:hypothetical protein B0H14DRAFT_3513811 [Mycena olivaceomarginata]|nr:hypothetical protein B0H14DRAFT_3513811 [Mycena olivaceomarginata]